MGRPLRLALAIAWGLTASAGLPDSALAVERADPLRDMLLRIDSFLHREESDGVTRDPRQLHNVHEEIRLSVVPQLLAYCDLYDVYKTDSHYRDIVSRADFLVERFDSVASRTASDGMLGLALLRAHEISGTPRYWDAAVRVVRQSLALEPLSSRLNWGLMAAMALAKYQQMTGDSLARAKASQIVRTTALYQNRDGSLPHFCTGSTDVHYTGWMAMELMVIGELLDEPAIYPMLAGAYRFLKGRLDPLGLPLYEDSVGSGLVTYYYSRATGCWNDYDTRGWVNELGYNAHLFDFFRDSRYQQLMARLLALEDHGAFPDKWDYFALPGDPIYPWASSERSVIRTSVVFWSLARVLSNRETMRPTLYLEAKEALSAGARGIEADEGPALPELQGFPFAEDGTYLGEVVREDVPEGTPASMSRAAAFSSRVAEAAPVAELGLGPIAPNPARPGTFVRFALPERAEVSLRVFDAGGRLMRELWSGPAEAGEHRLVWDGRDAAGHAVPAGVYFLRLVTPHGARAGRLLLLR